MKFTDLVNKTVHLVATDPAVSMSSLILAISKSFLNTNESHVYDLEYRCYQHTAQNHILWMAERSWPEAANRKIDGGLSIQLSVHHRHKQVYGTCICVSILYIHKHTYQQNLYLYLMCMYNILHVCIIYRHAMSVDDIYICT